MTAAVQDSLISTVWLLIPWTIELDPLGAIKLNIGRQSRNFKGLYHGFVRIAGEDGGYGRVNLSPS